MDYENRVIYNIISVRGLVLHTFIAFTPRLPMNDLSNYVISYYIPEVVNFINNSGIKRGTMTVEKFKSLYKGIEIDYVSTYTLCDILMFQLKNTPTRISLVHYLHRLRDNIMNDLGRFSSVDELNSYLYSRYY